VLRYAPGRSAGSFATGAESGDRVVRSTVSAPRISIGPTSSHPLQFIAKALLFGFLTNP